MRRTARIESDCGDAETARRVAHAVRPDNTAAIETTVEGDRVVTTIERDSTGSLQSTADDYIVNLGVAVQLATQDGDTSTETTQNT